MIRIDIQKKPADWFVNWFDSPLYHTLYRNRNEEEARDFIDVLLDEMDATTGAAILDLGCGNGRHSKYLASKNYLVTGIDLSLASIRQAKQFETPTLHFYRHDMRKPFATACFDFVFSFFTSFGYFEDEKENQQVMENISRALKPGGLLMLDYINAEEAKQKLRLFEEQTIDGIHYEIGRWYDARFIRKRIFVHAGSPAPYEFAEQVRSYSLEEMKNLADKTQLQVEQVYGDYELQPFLPKKSKRMIILARKQIGQA